MDSVLREEGLAAIAEAVEADLGARGLLTEGRARSWLAGCCAMMDFVQREMTQLQVIAAQELLQQRQRRRHYQQED